VKSAAPIEIRIRVKDTRGKLVRGAFVFVRSTPILTSTPTDAQTGRRLGTRNARAPTSPLKTGYNVQFTSRPTRRRPDTAGIYGSASSGGRQAMSD
jgi:hypothetical protein